jgi:hypothetical protein
MSKKANHSLSNKLISRFISNEEATKRKEDRIIESLSPEIGTLRLTYTMINKHIIDANASIRLAKERGQNHGSQKYGR